MTQKGRFLLCLFLSQFVGFKVIPDGYEVERNSESVDDPCGPEGAVIAPEFTEQTAYKYAQTYACIP